VKLSTWHKPETDMLIAGAAELYSASGTISAVRYHKCLNKGLNC